MSKLVQKIFSSLFSLLFILYSTIAATDVNNTLNQYTEEQVKRIDSTKFSYSKNDGPYVLWQTDSSAIVFYLCNEDLLSKTFAVIDTLLFSGFCKDFDKNYSIPAEPPEPEPHIINHVSRILAISDIHGEYELLVKFLKQIGVIDENHHWNWADGHLVIVGDVFDRGYGVNESLWLIRQLESEAKRNGGGVHYILGNHELMILRGDNRYVHESYLQGIVKETKIKYQDLYGSDMELGRWLRSKNTVIKINDIIFTHAGLSPFLVNLGISLADINETVRNSIDIPSSQLSSDDEVTILFGNKGPFWYRGYHYGKEGHYPKAPVAEIDSILWYYAATTIVIGHTEVKQVLGLYDNRIIAIDIPTDELGTLQGLFWNNGEFYRVTGRGDYQLIK